jgi:hypothetical protein
VLGPAHHRVVTCRDGNPWVVYQLQNSGQTGGCRFPAIDRGCFDGHRMLHAGTTTGAGEPAP